MRTVIFTFLCVCFFHFADAQTALQNTFPLPNLDHSSSTYLKSIEERLSELEHQQRENENWYNNYYVLSKNRMTPFLGEKISFGGFFETTMTHMSGPDTLSQTSADSNALGINLAADFDDRFRLVTQYINVFNYIMQNPHNNPALTPSQRQFGSYFFGTYVAHAYLEYRHSDALVIQTGLGYVPFGAAFEQREPFLFKYRQGPQMLGSSENSSVGVAFPLWMGLHLSGTFDLENSRYGYNVYTFSPSSNTKTLGAGGRIWWTNSNNLKLGTSIQTGEQAANYYYSYGIDANYKVQHFEFNTEYARNVASGGVASIESYYFEPSYAVGDGEWIVYAIFDYLKNPLHTDGATADSYEKWITGTGVNWLPIANVRLRLGILQHDYVGATETLAGQRRDYFTIDFSAGIAF